MPRLNPEVGELFRSLATQAIKDYGIALPNTEINPSVGATPATTPCKCSLIPMDTITATIHEYYKAAPSKIAILNFASFKNPGGGYLSNSIAQEEALCYCTNLYPALELHRDTWYASHASKLHNGMYEDQSLLSHGVTVIASAPGNILPKNDCFKIDVLTCAAPNWTSGLRYGSLSYDTMVEASTNRVDYVMRILSYYEYDTVILGAFGCGVFKNDALTVAKAFKAGMNRYAFNNVVFAIPDRESYNYKVFEAILSR